MPVDLDATEMKAWRGLLFSHARLIKVLDSELSAATGVSLSQYEVLLFLDSAPGRSMRMSQLAESSLLSKSGMTRSIDHLVRRGLVERQRCSSDARGLLAVLTDPGAKKLREAAPVHLAGVRRHFSSKLDSSQLDILGNLLWKVSNEKDDAVECTPAV